MEIWQIVPIVYIIIGAVSFFTILAKPKFFWPFLIVISVGATGLIMIPKSPYCVALVDEFLLVCVIAAAIIALLVGAVKTIKSSSILFERIHQLFFFTLVSYMLAQSVRGLILWQNPLLVRWVIFYSLIIVIAFFISSTDLPMPRAKNFIKIILWSALVYLVAYLCHGLFTQYVLGISPFSLNVQGVQWAGASYALFPLLVAIPAALVYLRHYRGLRQWLGWSVIALGILAAYFYDSRAALIAIGAFAPLLFFTLSWRKNLVALALLFGSLAVYHWHDMAIFLKSIVQSATFSYSGDFGRWTIITAAIMAISQNFGVFLFGYGIHSHHYVLGEFMEKAGHPTITSAVDYSQTTLPGGALVYNYTGQVPDYVRVTGFGGLLTDIGLVGILLFGAVFAITLLRILFLKNTPVKFLAALPLILAMSLMFFVKMEDIVLLWLMIMPSGILLSMANIRLTPGMQKKISRRRDD